MLLVSVVVASKVPVFWVHESVSAHPVLMEVVWQAMLVQPNDFDWECWDMEGENDENMQRIAALGVVAVWTAVVVDSELEQETNTSFFVRN